MADLECKKPKPCEPKPEPKPEPCSKPFELCVGDRVLKWDGFCLTAERPRKTPDGTYTSVTVVDGCIVDYGYADEPTYTPPYCNPNPCPCQSGSGSGGNGGTGGSGSGGTGGSGNISNTPGNTIIQTSNGLYARTYINGGSGIAVTGVGTMNNPYTISAVSNSGVAAAVVGRNGIVSEVNDKVTYIGLEETNSAGIYDINDQFTVDRFGRITHVEKRKEPIIATGSGLESTNQGDTTLISHPTYNFAKTTLELGGYTVNINDSGHIISTKQDIDIQEGIYNLGVYDVEVNSLGSIASIKQRTDLPEKAGSFTTVDGKTVNYDETGRITSIVDNNGSGSGGTPPSSTTAPLPIVAMGKLTCYKNGSIYDKASLGMEVYGWTDVGLTVESSSSFSVIAKIPLPSYITNSSQITVAGVTTWNCDFTKRALFISLGVGQVSTVVLRG